MEYKIEALNCPNCGAPLNVKPNEEFTFCLYCDSSIRITKHDETGEHSAVHTEIPKEVIDEVKKLILSGDKAKAIEVYQKASNISESEATKLIETFVEGITNKIVLTRPLSIKGILISTLFLLIFLSTGYVLIAGIPNSLFVKIIYWVLFIFSALNFFSLWRSIFVTIKYAAKKWNDATILKYFFISQKKKFSFYKVLLEVKEPAGTTFRTETNIMIKTVDTAKLQEGKIIEIKYFPDEKNNVVASVRKLLEIVS
jgi:hypothetical protein